ETLNHAVQPTLDGDSIPSSTLRFSSSRPPKRRKTNNRDQREQKAARDSAYGDWQVEPMRRLQFRLKSASKAPSAAVGDQLSLRWVLEYRPQTREPLRLSRALPRYFRHRRRRVLRQRRARVVGLHRRV